MPDRDGAGRRFEGRTRTIADNKRATLTKLYQHDARAAPWNGTAHGVLQAVNTYEHHENTVHGSARAERDATRTTTGSFGHTDRAVSRQLTATLP